MNRFGLKVVYSMVSLIAMCSMLVSSCSSKGADDDIDDTPNPPSAVTDLTIADYSPTTVVLSWTVPVNDNQHGVVSSYDIRYTNHDPETTDWDSAYQVMNEPDPSAGGFTQSMTVDNLTYGLTYYFGMKCIGQQGLQSDISNMVEVYLPIDYEVTFTDPALDTVIRQILNKPSGDILYSELLTITEIGASNHGILSLSGLEHCDNLVFLHATDNQITDLSPIGGLTKLWALDVIGNQITDVSGIASVISLGQLVLGQNMISDISSLDNLTNLTVLRLHYNDIVDIGALQYMTELHWVDLSGNDITDISPLLLNSGLGAGDTLYISSNPLSSTSVDTYIPELQSRGVDVFY